jgi:endo-1,4-beta-xylanase
MRKASLRTFALVLGCVAIACSATNEPPENGGPSSGGTSTGGSATGGFGGLSTGGAQTGGVSTGGFTTGGTSTGGGGTGGSTPSGGTAGGGNTGGSNTGGGGIGGTGTGGSMAGGGMTGGSTSGGAGAGGNNGGRAAGGTTAGGGMTGGTTSGGAGAGGAIGGTGGNPTQQPDCNAQMPSGGTLRSGQGTGGTGNLAWEIWSNTMQGQLTTYSVPAFIAAWNNSGGYLGRLGFEWNRFGEDPVPHTERGTITAQFVSRKTGTAGGYSYVGMYGWTTNPCVEWYVVDDSYNTMPINPGSTTNRGERQIDGGTYIMYTRPTTGTGGTRCSNVTNWIQYYSVRRTARACGVISLTEHFNAWQSLNMDMTGDLLEAKILVEVGGGVGNVELPIANVTVR